VAAERFPRSQTLTGNARTRVQRAVQLWRHLPGPSSTNDPVVTLQGYCGPIGIREHLGRVDDALKHGVQVYATNSDGRAQFGKNLRRPPIRTESRHQLRLGL